MPMDPLSITLAVITLAKALKDIIEKAELIRDSFSELPQNYRNAKRLADEVLKTLHVLEGIYQKHEQALNKETLLKKAINDLQIEMKSVHEECAHLILPVSERKGNRFKVAIHSLWSRGKVERLLSELKLKDHVDRCSQQFHLLSSFHTDALIIEMHSAMVQPTNHGSVVVHNHTRLGGTSMSYSELGNVTNTQLVSFTRSTPMPMTRNPDTITEHDLSKAYLRLQIGKINHSLRSILAHWSQNPPIDVEISTLASTWGLEQPLMPSLIVHQDAIVLSIRIQSLLQHNQSNLSIINVNAGITWLSDKLQTLEMYEDALAMDTLMVDFWRDITRRHPSPDSSRYLVHALKLVAVNLSDVGDWKQARLKANEAINILWSLTPPGPVDVLHLELKEDLLQYVTLNSNLSLSEILQLDAALGLNIFQSEVDSIASSCITKLQNEEISNNNLYTYPSEVAVSSPSHWALTASKLTVKLRNQEMSDDVWYTYALSLCDIEEGQNQPSKSHNFKKSALMILNHLFAKYPDSRRVQAKLESVLGQLSSMSVHKTDSAALTEILQFRNQRLTVLRQLVLINPQRYVLDLSDALWEQRQNLLALGRPAEAENAYQDMISLKDLAAAPPHSDLKIPSETEADYYIRLAERHYHAGRLSDAIYATQNAISQYSALEFMNGPGQSCARHVSALVVLCKCFNEVHQFDAVLVEGDKAIKMIEDADADIHGSDSDLMDLYGQILHEMMCALEESSYPATRRFAQAEDINTRIRKLACSGKVKSYKWSLALGLVAYAKVLQKNGLIKEAVEYLQDLLDNWENLDLSSAYAISTIAHVDCFEQLEEILQKEEDVEKILHYSKAVRTIIRKILPEHSWSDSDLEFVSSELRQLDLDHIYLLLDVGHYPEALELSKVIVLDISKDSPVVESKDTKALAEALDSLAQVQLYSCMPDDAVATTMKALSLWQKVLEDNPHTGYFIHNRQYSCLLVCMHGLHDIGKVEEALNRLDEAEKMAQKWKSVNSVEELGAMTVGDGSEYKTLLFERSRLLFTKGHYLEAVKFINKVEHIQKEHSKRSNLSTLEFSVKILSYSCILYCTLGRHEEGLAAATELAKSKKYIRETFPGRAREMDVRLDRMKRQGAWKSVQDAKERLTCTHQLDF